MRAYENAFAALNAQRIVPHRNFERDVALVPFCRAGRKCAAEWQSADGQAVAVPGDHRGKDVPDKRGRARRNWREDIESARSVFWYAHLMEIASVASTAAKFFCTTASP